MLRSHARQCRTTKLGWLRAIALTAVSVAVCLDQATASPHSPEGAIDAQGPNDRNHVGAAREARPSSVSGDWFSSKYTGLKNHLGRCKEQAQPGKVKDWVPLLLTLGATVGMQIGLDPPKESRWESRNSFDDGVRSALKGGSRGTREAAQDATDALFGALGATLVFDWVYHCGVPAEGGAAGDAPQHYGLLRSLRHDLAWFLANNVSTEVAKASFARQRPYVRPCSKNSDYISDCDSGSSDNASFYSGHASSTATLAGLLCARHMSREEVTTADKLLCGVPAVGAVATAILRIVGEKHFVTDVLAGWGSGAVFGYLLPTRYSYGNAEAAPTQGFRPIRRSKTLGLEFAIRF